MIRNLVASGARSADDPRAELWQGFMAVVADSAARRPRRERARPPLVGRRQRPHGFLRVAARTRVRVDARVLDAFQFGVPQHRARLILVGLRDGGEFEWPEPSERDHDTP